MHKEALKGDEAGSKSKNLAQNAMTYVKRYYSNNFTDQDKQNAINVFLGDYIPTAESGQKRPHIFETENEHYDDTSKREDLKRQEFLGGFFAPDLEWYSGPGEFYLPSQQQGRSRERSVIQKSHMDSLMNERYDPTSLSSFEEELKRDYNVMVTVKSPGKLEEKAIVRETRHT